MTGIRRVSQLGTTGESTYVDGSIQAADIADGAIGTADIAANAVTQAKLSTDIPLSGFRNVLINGDMRINQRGGSYTLSGNYTLDRWYLGVNTSHTVSQSTSSPPAGFQNFMRVQRASGSTNTTVPQIAQSLETSASIPLQGKQVTVSFYARAGANYSATSNTFNWRIYGGTGTDQNSFSYTGASIPVDQSVTLTTSWQRFSYTVSSLTSYNEYAFFFYYATTGTAGAADYVDITGVQLEVGSQATPFEQRPIGTELALCQRYFWKHSSSAGISYLSFNYAGTQYRLTIPNPVQMRINPHTVITSTWQGGTTPSLGAANVLSTNWTTTGGWFYVDPSTSIEISAEL
jgi:hypothetical protein